MTVDSSTKPESMDTAEIRNQFLEFFRKHSHEVVASSSLVPGNDKTLLFTNAGMVQFKDVFTGDEKRDYQRATTSQRCVRAGGKHNDLDNVGYTARHHTFFEMLGNFSFGDYFKEQAIDFAWEFLTGVLALPADRLWVTVFEEDDEAHDLWINRIGVPPERVIRIGAKDNFWAMGDTGPCGPCSEIFFDHGPDVEGGPPGSPEEDGDRYIEIWNLVFMQFDRAADGTMTPLPKPCVDTGMGLERIAAVLQKVHSNYEIDLFSSLIRETAKVIGVNDLEAASLRVITDHVRSCAFLIADGVVPSNEGRGYVLRRIIRRAARHGHKLGATEPFFHRLVEPLKREMGEAYPELAASQGLIEKELLEEEERFNVTLAGGMKILESEIQALSAGTRDGAGAELSGDVVFKLYDTFGFPLDLTADIARERGLDLDQAGFDAAMQQQREMARKASSFDAVANRVDYETATTFVGYDNSHYSTRVDALFLDGQRVEQLENGQSGIAALKQTPFYAESGGQVGDTGVLTAGSTVVNVTDTKKQNQSFLHSIVVTEGTLKVGDVVDANVDTERRLSTAINHSATHLLHGGLRHVLGAHVEQRGSLVDPHHLRFDFSHRSPVSDDEIQQIERWVNDEVRRNGPTVIREMSMDQALEAGAIALFGEKYGSTVRVVSIGDESTELCGGTHVSAAGDIGAFRISSETGVAAGIRRIEALGGSGALDMNNSESQTLQRVSGMLKTSPGQLEEKVRQLQEENRELGRELSKLQSRLSSQAGSELAGDVKVVSGVNLVLKKVESADSKALRGMIDQLKQSLENAAVVLASEHKGKVTIIAGVSKPLNEKLRAGDLVNRVAEPLGGKGGGRADMAQAGAPSLDELDKAFALVPDWIEQTLG